MRNQNWANQDQEAAQRALRDGTPKPPEHNPDCDGWWIDHRQEVRRDGIVRRLFCVVDGAVTPWVGKGVTDTSLQRLARCHPGWVACEGQCRAEGSGAPGQ